MSDTLTIVEEAQKRLLNDEIEVVRAERQEALDALTGDDLLEKAYEGLSILYAELKAQIRAYFYKSGRWEEPEVPDPPPVAIPASEVALMSKEDQENLTENEDGTFSPKTEPEPETESDFSLPVIQ